MTDLEQRVAAALIDEGWDLASVEDLFADLAKHRLAITAAPDAEGAGLDALPDNACGVMGLCELLKGHEGKHTTSVDRALEGVVLRATHATPPAPTPASEDELERLAVAMHLSQRWCDGTDYTDWRDNPNGEWDAAVVLHGDDARAVLEELPRADALAATTAPEEAPE